MKIYNTFTRTKEDFVSIEKNKVGMYVCGPTVYGTPHLGHAKSYVNFDTIFRYLKFAGYDVNYVQNITDVGHLVGDGDNGKDKIAEQANKENIDVYQIARKYENQFFDAMDKLNMLRPTVSCRATDNINEMIELVQTIIDKGYGYVTDKGNVYFDVKKYKNYGQLSNRKLENNLSGERIAVASDKKNNEDFALWKSVEPNTLMKWESPWGVGCPGWHLECTALAKKYLGDVFDIHGGGIDNVFPHHECECAQGDVAVGRIPMNYFMHNGLVTINGTKMGKSLGNFITLPDLFEKYNPAVIKYFVLQFHYRSNIDFNDEELLIAKKQFEKLQSSINAVWDITQKVSTEITNADLVALLHGFTNAMDQDFNTPLALVEVNKLNKIIAAAVQVNDELLLTEINKFVSDVCVQGLGLNIQRVVEEQQEFSDEVKDLAEQRWQAKQNRDFALADGCRDKLKDLGYEILDSRQGYSIKKI